MQLSTRLGVGAGLFAVVLSLPATARADSQALLEPFGLEGRSVSSLGMYGRLYAGTIDDGVFRRDLEAPAWTPLGLDGVRIRAVYPHASGAIGFTTTVGIEGDPPSLDAPLVYCSELDQPPWVPTDDGIPRGDVFSIWSIDGFPSPAVCGETFATSIGSPGGVWRRGFGGVVWELVLDVEFGAGNVVRVDASSGNVWAGGENAVLAPWIARSTDQGDTWQIAYPDLGGDNACNAIAIHPDDPDVAYAGMEGLVIETSDGGVTWSPTGLVGTAAYIYGVALDAGAPSHVLAGGTVLSPNDWALWESFDQGQTWSVVSPSALSPPESVSGIAAIVADPTQAGTFYIATSGHGVWRYQNPVTAVADPPDDDSAPGRRRMWSHPNPFNLGTTLVFSIPGSLDGAHGRLVVHDVRGNVVRVLVDEVLTAGTHRVRWNGEDGGGRVVPSGVYYGELRVGSIRQTCKLSLLK